MSFEKPNEEVKDYDPEKVENTFGSSHNQAAHSDALGLQFEEQELPPGYFRSSFFLGSMLAIGLGLLAGVAGFGYIAPILNLVNADVGPGISSGLPYYSYIKMS
jgi:hypothetical protein